MRRLIVIALIAGLIPMSITATANACYCGAARHRCCKQTCCQTQCCAPTKTCKEVVYEEKQITLYKTVYEEVMDKVVVDAVKYVEETEYRCVKCTVMQPKQANACGPVKTCAPASCCETAPVEIMRKAPFTVVRAVSYQKTEERPRVVEKQVPYTVTVCVPQVPVDVCSPVPPCCAPKDKPY